MLSRPSSMPRADAIYRRFQLGDMPVVNYRRSVSAPPDIVEVRLQPVLRAPARALFVCAGFGNHFHHNARDFIGGGRFPE